METVYIVMIVVWGLAIAAAIVVEYFTCQIISISLVPGGIAAVVLSAVQVDVWIQIVVFFALGLLCFAAFRPLYRKYLQKGGEDTSFTVKNQNIGKRFRLVSEVVDGKASIVISDVRWTCIIKNEEDAKKLRKDDYIEIVDFDGNKPIVKAV
ncbi:MAG: NfeD family protein [Firmicutes bacterium]|nr:NfeD family protein [Bacillota bacterium]